MTVISKSEQAYVNIPEEKTGTDNAAEILRAIMAVRRAHADALRNWDGKAAGAAKKAFAKFSAELDRYETMVGRFAGLYSKQGGCDGD